MARAGVERSGAGGRGSSVILNLVTADQISNMIISIALLILSLMALHFAPQLRGFGLIFCLIAIVNIGFYCIVIFTNINEAHQQAFDIISGIRTAFTLTALCGACAILVLLYGKRK